MVFLGDGKAQRQLSSITPSCPGFDSINDLDVAWIYPSRWWEESGQRVDDVDRTHLVAVIKPST